MLRWVDLCWCWRWKQNAPKPSIFIDVFLACYFENMKKPESFWCCDSHAILKVAFCFIQNKKLIKGVQGLVQLWSLNSFCYSVGLMLGFWEDFIRFVQEASCSLKSYVLTCSCPSLKCKGRDFLDAHYEDSTFCMHHWNVSHLRCSKFTWK